MINHYYLWLYMTCFIIIFKGQLDLETFEWK